MPSGYPEERAPIVSLWFEFEQRHGLSFESRLFATGGTVTPVKGHEPGDEEPQHVVYINRSVYALMLEPSVTYAPVKLKRAPLQPFAGLGVAVGAVHINESGDLSVGSFGADAGIVPALGVRFTPARATSVVLRGSYRKMFRDSGGSINDLGLSGAALEFGLRFPLR